MRLVRVAVAILMAGSSTFLSFMCFFGFGFSGGLGDPVKLSFLLFIAFALAFAAVSSMLIAFRCIARKKVGIFPRLVVAVAAILLAFAAVSSGLDGTVTAVVGAYSVGAAIIAFGPRSTGSGKHAE